MHEFAEAIKLQISNIEPVFLQLGQDMQHIYFESGELTDIITRSADTIGAKSEGGLIQHIQVIVSDLLNELKDYRETITLNTSHMSSSTGELQTLCQICAELTKITRFLNVVGMNIDVESCRSVESRNMFQGFGGEVKDLAKKIGEIAEHIYSDAKSVQATQLSGVADVKKSLEELFALSESAESGVRHAMHKVETLTHLSYSTLDNAAAHSEEIQKQMGDIVMSIQFHDIVRQKLEHIVSSFEDCQQLLTQNTSVQMDQDATPENKNITEKKKADSSEKRHLFFKSKKDNKNHKSSSVRKEHVQIYFILKIQAAQLSRISSELNTVYKDLKKAFTNINDKTGSLTGDVAGSGMEKKEARELENQFKSIKKALENLKRLRDHGQKISSTMMTSIKNASSIISGLSQYTDQVKSININLQYKALNAIIMTSKLGEKGRTLEVLAREVRLISLNSNELMGKTVNTLRTVTELTANLKELKKDKNEERSEILSLSLDDSVNQLSSILENYQKNTDRSVTMSQKLGEDIEKIRERLDFIRQWADDIEAIDNKLNRLIDSIQPLILSMDKETLIEFETISKRYTMESERVVHNQMSVAKKDQILSTDQGNNPLFEQQALEHDSKHESGQTAEPDNNDEDEQDDEFDDNIELF